MKNHYGVQSWLSSLNFLKGTERSFTDSIRGRISDVSVQTWNTKDLCASDIAFSCFNTIVKEDHTHFSELVAMMSSCTSAPCKSLLVEICHKVKISIILLICSFHKMALQPTVYLIARLIKSILYWW